MGTEITMPFLTYGYLIGKLTGHEDQPGGNPHYQLDIDAGRQYRVAVNLESTFEENKPISELQYQIVDISKLEGAQNLLAALKGANEGFTLTAGTDGLALDFVKDKWLSMDAFQTVGQNDRSNPFYDALVQTAASGQENGATVVVFGTGFPDPSQQGSANRRGRGAFNPSRAGFQGVDNIHMNQGSFEFVDGIRQSFYQENAPRQDGAVIFLMPDGTAPGFFTKFQTQDTDTDVHGNPVHTGVPALDSVSPEVFEKTKKPIFSQVAALRRQVAITPNLPPDKTPRGGHVFASNSQLQSVGASNAGTGSGQEGPPSEGSGGVLAAGPIFGGPGSADNNLAWQNESDTTAQQNWAEQYGSLQTVPGPRPGVPLNMPLASVIGQPACDAIEAAGTIVFHAVGDTGATTQQKVQNEDDVSQLMINDFGATGPNPKPSFFFHLGDVVYFYGEPTFYYEQFYEPFKLYPGPIFAIPGNHDGLTNQPGMESLAGFKAAFVDDKPRKWSYSGGIERTTMTQPGVYFTLDAPLVSIIGLYSNCSEGPGVLDQQQLIFFRNELTRLKPLRESGQVTAVILAVHHPPLSHASGKPGSTDMLSDLESACTDIDFYPDAVLSGHAHVYQRLTRDVTIDGVTRPVPFIVAGGGGYTISPAQKIPTSLDSTDPTNKLHNFIPKYGYLTVTVSKASGENPATLKILFQSTDPGSADGCGVNLETHQLL
jgi:uncharacterized protein YukJ